MLWGGIWMEKYKNIIAIVIMGVLVVGYFYYLNNKDVNKGGEEEVVVELTEIENVLETDITSAMKTPREAVKFYSSIMKCYYNESPTEEHVEQLGKKAKELFDDELAETNQDGAYLSNLQKEVETFAEARKKVMSYTVQSSSDVEYYREDKREYAIVLASYTFRETEIFEKSNEEYILRKDDEGNWKILGWRLTEDVVVEEEDE